MGKRVFRVVPASDYDDLRAGFTIYGGIKSPRKSIALTSERQAVNVAQSIAADGVYAFVYRRRPNGWQAIGYVEAY
jgi:hypothetical protein